MPTGSPIRPKNRPTARSSSARAAARDDAPPQRAAKTNDETVFDAGEDAGGFFRVSLLDVGPDEYGDAVLCQFGNKSILIDGSHPGDQNGKSGHPSIPDQLKKLLQQPGPPIRVSLIIVTHAHQDHIGCLPQLIKDDTLRADWALAIDPQLGWGRAGDEDRDAVITDGRVRALVAALREEVRTDRTDDAALEQFMADAVTLEDRYIAMLDTLAERGTRVVRFGRDSTSALTAAFASVGLKIIGPSRAHLLECADVINNLSHDSIRRATDAVRGDAVSDALSVYRRLTNEDLDALDVQRPGPAVNLQSIVTRFQYRGQKFLFAGDMQFAKPEVDNEALVNSVRRLRQKIAQDAPFAFAKLSHHGSYNAFSEEIFAELGDTTLFGICAGEESKSHPNVKVLKVLDEHRQDIRWVRTDHNGLVTITFGDGAPEIKKTRGQINDAQPNTQDVLVEVGEAASPSGELVAPAPLETPLTTAQPQTQATSEMVEVHARIPHTTTRVTITVDVQPGGGGATPFPPQPPEAEAASSPDALRIAGGRQLPQLLFVTSRDALAANIGQAECAQVLASIRARGLPLFDALPRGLNDANAAARLVSARLAQLPNVRGVVLLGGYDVVPSKMLDALPPQLRQRLPSNDDPDNFIVWSDDLYGGRQAGAQPQLPVSRIPDGKSSQLVFGALQAPNRRPGERRSGIRNVARPFADEVFARMPGSREIHVSKPATFNQQPSIDLRSERVYLMLHGDYVDSSRFWGEGTQQSREAVNVSNVPDGCGPVVFTGCCWGALTVDTPAGLVDPGRPFGQKTPGASIALAFLAKGATAFIGCTGAHYSPTVPPYKFYGGPMHEAFWRHYDAGASPAQALFNAKREYAAGIPHGQRGLNSQAIENKILRQYSCLGLGW